MVTKQQQLEFAAKHIEKWKSGYDFAVVEKTIDGHLYVRWPSICTSGITKKEWQQERNKMSSKPVVDNSWHERGDFPPGGTICDIRVAPNDWIDKVEIVHSKTGQGVVVKLLPSTDVETYLSTVSHKIDFRPLNTERENAVDEMVSVILDYDGYMITSATAELVARQLHDSGYHR